MGIRPVADVNFDDITANNGFNLVISGIRANASIVGDGEDIMVNVLVGEERVNTAPLKVADVTTGLAVKADAVEGLQCSDADADSGFVYGEDGHHHNPRK